MSGNDEVTRLILDKSKKNVNIALDVTLITPLHYAAEADYYEVTKSLLEFGADVRMAQRHSQYNALHLAIRADCSTKLVKMLLNSDTAKGYERQKLLDTKVWGDTALHMAAEHAKNSTIQVLLDHGAQLESKSYFNEDTAMMAAVRNGRKATAEYLLDQNARIEAVDVSGRSALMIAAENGFVRNTEMLLGRKADVRAVDYNGSTALHLAARNAGEMSSQNSADIIRMLLSEGADVNAKNEKNQTPLDKAVNRQDGATISLLRSYGAVLYKPNPKVREMYLAYFDVDKDATPAGRQGSLDSLTTTKSESPPLETPLLIEDGKEEEGEPREINGVMQSESVLKALEVKTGGAITAEPEQVMEKLLLNDKKVSEKNVEAGLPSPPSSVDGKA